MNPFIKERDPIAGVPVAVPLPVDGAAWEPESAFRVPWMLRIAFALVIFAVPFETVETPITSGTFSAAKIAGWLFFLTAVFYPRQAFTRGSYVIWMFVIYVAVYFFYGLYQDPRYMPLVNERTLTLLQMIVFLWIASNLLADHATARVILLTLGVSTALLSLLQLLGITSMPVDTVTTRVSALGEDPNSAAAVADLGFLSLLGVAYFSDIKSLLLKLAVIPLMGVILIMIIQTESRTGILALVFGMLFFLINKKGRFAALKNIIVVGGSAVIVIMMTLSNPETYERFEVSYYQGNLAKREKILPLAIEMVQEKPLLGWGPFTNTTELGRRMNMMSRDTHNLFLLVLTEVGILGSLPYFIGWAGCLRNAWKARNLSGNVVPLVLLACLFLVNMGISWHNRKLHWLVLAYCLACVPYKKILRPNVNPFTWKLYAMR